MPPRLRLLPAQLQPSATQYICRHCRHASLATAPGSATLVHHSSQIAPRIARFPSTQPPSYKPAEFRKTQLHRQYQSLLRSSPVVLLFQHNNLKATEFMALRRELAQAMRKLDEEHAKSGDVSNIGSEAKLQVVQTGILAAALKVVEFWDPKFDSDASVQASSTVAPGSSQSLLQEKVTEHRLTHGLSKDAWAAGWRKNKTIKHGLEPLLSGPIALFTLPSVSTAHLRAALSILAPSATFPAPKRKANPGYYELPVQNALQKLMLLGARVEGKAFDTEGVQWVGSIQGGLDGLRAQLVAALQGAGASVTSTLESAGRSLYLTVEGRRIMLEEEAKGPGNSE